MVATETFCVLGGFWGNIWLGAIHLVAGWGGTGGGVRALHGKYWPSFNGKYWTSLHGKYWPSFNPPPTKHNLLLQREDFSLGKKKINWAGTQFEDEVWKWWSSQFLLPFRQQKDIKELCPGLPENGSDFQKRSQWEASRVVSIPPAKTKNNKRSLWFSTDCPFVVIKWHLEILVCICVECFMLTPHSTIYWSGADSHKSVFGWVSVGASNSSIHHKRSYITYTFMISKFPLLYMAQRVSGQVGFWWITCAQENPVMISNILMI